MKIIIRFPNKKLSKEERTEVAMTFHNAGIICVDKELELYQINDNKEVKKIF